MTVLNWASKGILVSVLGNAVIPKFTGNSIGEVADGLNDSLSPDSKIFAIWSFIYGSILFGSYSNNNIGFSNIDKSPSIKKTFLYGTTAFNILWIYLWTSKRTELASISLFGLSGTLIYVLFRKKYWEIFENNRRLLFGNGISTYAIWSLYASLINISFIL